MITIKENGSRFGSRVGAIIYNKDKTKILLEKQDKMYMFPGGRIDIHEDSKKAINRELKEELNIQTSLNLKYVAEMFLKSLSTKYHEIGFYYLTILDENKIPNGFKSLDGDSTYYWINVQELNDVNVLAKAIKDKVINQITDDKLEYILYRQY